MAAQSAALTARVLGALIAALAVGGCAAVAPRSTTPAPPSAPAPRPSDEPARRAEPSRPPAESGASAALIGEARAASAGGDYAAASAAIERALRIEPNNPRLWVELGEIRLAAGDAEQAEIMARKALTLAGSDRSIAERAARLIGR